MRAGLLGDASATAAVDGDRGPWAGNVAAGDGGAGHGGMSGKAVCGGASEAARLRTGVATGFTAGGAAGSGMHRGAAGSGIDTGAAGSGIGAVPAAAAARSANFRKIS